MSDDTKQKRILHQMSDLAICISDGDYGRDDELKAEDLIDDLQSTTRTIREILAE